MFFCLLLLRLLMSILNHIYKSLIEHLHVQSCALPLKTCGILILTYKYCEALVNGLDSWYYQILFWWLIYLRYRILYSKFPAKMKTGFCPEMKCNNTKFRFLLPQTQSHSHENSILIIYLDQFKYYSKNRNG